MRIRIAFLLAVGVLGIVSAVAAAALLRPPTPTTVGPIEIKVEDASGGNGDKKGNDGGKDSNQPAESDGGATAVPDQTPIPAGDDHGGDDDNSGPGSGDDNSGPGSGDDDPSSGSDDDG